jgi:hypothetical protein
VWLLATAGTLSFPPDIDEHRNIPSPAGREKKSCATGLPILGITSLPRQGGETKNGS